MSVACACMVLQCADSRWQCAGVGHGVRRSLVSIGSVLGSLWAAAALHNMILLYGVPIGLLLVAIVSMHEP